MSVNRDYFTQPEQGSRSAHDYGRTTFSPTPTPKGYYTRRLEYGLTGLVVFLSTIACVWAVCRPH